VKYKPGKGRKPKRQLKVFKMKTGGQKFVLSGKQIAPKGGVAIGRTVHKTNVVHSLLEAMGFRIQSR